MKDKDLNDWIEKDYHCLYCGRKFSRKVKIKVPANMNIEKKVPGRHSWSSMVRCKCGNFLKT